MVGSLFDLDLLKYFLQLCCVYYIGGGVLHFIVPVFFRVRNVQSGTRPPHQLQHDALQSLGPLLVKSFIWRTVSCMHANGISRLYITVIIDWKHILYCLWTGLLLDLLHDTWFYFVHRLLHAKLLYHRIHSLHHRSKLPTAFTGYSFHTVEAFMVFANEILVCFLLPLDVNFHRLYHLLTTLIHQGGHVGYEVSPFTPSLFNLLVTLLPGSFRRKLAMYWLNTVQHHDIHHTHVVYHYSLYFTHWDRILFTLNPKYDKIIQQQSCPEN